MAIQVIYGIAAVLCGVVLLFILALYGGFSRIQVRGVPSPSGIYIADVGTFTPVVDTEPMVIIRPNSVIPLGIGRIMPRGEAFTFGAPIRGSSPADIISVEWECDAVLVITYYGTRGRWTIQRSDRGNWFGRPCVADSYADS